MKNRNPVIGRYIVLIAILWFVGSAASAAPMRNDPNAISIIGLAIGVVTGFLILLISKNLDYGILKKITKIWGWLIIIATVAGTVVALTYGGFHLVI